MIATDILTILINEGIVNNVKSSKMMIKSASMKDKKPKNVSKYTRLIGTKE